MMLVALNIVEVMAQIRVMSLTALWKLRALSNRLAVQKESSPILNSCYMGISLDENLLRQVTMLPSRMDRDRLK